MIVVNFLSCITCTTGICNVAADGAGEEMGKELEQESYYIHIFRFYTRLLRNLLYSTSVVLHECNDMKC